jgi:2,3-dihydroxybenzoate-AMP ligase
VSVQLEGHVPIPPDRAERYRRAGHWAGLGLADLVLGAPGRRDGRVALVDGDQRVTYGELRTATERLAARLRGLGLRRQDRVVVQLPNGAPFVTLVLALWRLGAIPVLALPAHREHELRHLLTMSGASGLAVPAWLHRSDHLAVARRLLGGRPLLLVLGGADLGPGEVDLAAAIRMPWDGLIGDPGDPPHEIRTPPPRFRGDPGDGPSGGDVALLLLSGGSTGLPKLIPRTHDDYGYNLRVSADLCGLDERSVYLASLPAAHNFALGCPGVMGTLALGGYVVLGPAALDVMTRERVTITAAVPTLAARWADAVELGAPRPRGLRLLQVGGARLAPDAARRLQRVLGCALQQVYGMAEGLLCCTRLDDPEEVVAGTQGRPASPDDEVRIVDGELWARGPYTIAGYFRAPATNAAAFTDDGFYRTGDLVRRHPSGNLVVEGRVKDVINRGGEKIAAAELEELALAHPAVAQVAAVAMPDRSSGEAVCLYAVARAGAVLTLDGIRSFLDRRGLARYKLPDRLEVVDELPLTAVGKVDKSALREWVAHEADA